MELQVIQLMTKYFLPNIMYFLQHKWDLYRLL